MTVLTLYGKPGCCLCDDAKQTIAAVRDHHSFELREVDVSLDPGLHREYGERIPVLEVDGGSNAGRFALEAYVANGDSRDRG